MGAPDVEAILGGYRYLFGGKGEAEGGRATYFLATSHMFHFSENFMRNYMPYTIELGRSFVTLEYQSTRQGSKRPVHFGQLVGRSWGH